MAMAALSRLTRLLTRCTPSVVRATTPASSLASALSTLPRRVTTPSLLCTSIGAFSVVRLHSSRARITAARVASSRRWA
ncbi:hypothetical protein D3C75_1200350 [compost metagenome]